MQLDARKPLLPGSNNRGAGSRKGCAELSALEKRKVRRCRGNIVNKESEVDTKSGFALVKVILVQVTDCDESFELIGFVIRGKFFS